MNVKVIEKDLMNPLAEINKVNLDLNQIPCDFEYVTLLDNTKPGADVILGYVEENLGNRKFIWVQKPAGAPATIKQLEIAAKSEIVVLALGDCGSCSSWVILDAIRLEKMGTPTISICSDRFSSFAHELAKSHGAKDLNIVSLEHPIAGLSTKKIGKKTLEILPSLLYILKIP
jgi:hypothetical protein